MASTLHAVKKSKLIFRYDNFEACWIIIVHHFHCQSNHLLPLRKKVMGNEILQRQRVVRQGTERRIRFDQREVEGFAASLLAVVCKQMQQLHAMLGPAVYRGKGMTYKTLETMRNTSAWLQQCWKSCANGSKIVALRFDDHETKEMLGDVGSKLWPVSNFAHAQQHATRCTNGRNMYHLTMLGVVGQESCVLLQGGLLGKKEGKNV